MNKITFPPILRIRVLADDGSRNSKSIGELQAALQKLKMNIQSRELASKELGPSTIDAIRAFQERAGLVPEGSLTAETVERFNAELEHTFAVDSKTRTRRLQEMLQQTATQVDLNEVKSRILGSNTKRALKRYQAQAGLPQGEKVSEEIVNSAA